MSSNESQLGVQKKGIVWHNLAFFGITTLLGTVGLAIYTWKVGLKPVDWALFFFMGATTMLATTMGHHRLFAHRAFKANRLTVFLNLFFGAAAFEGSALNWSSEHRDHHRFLDTEKDPYSITKGFWHAHMGWFIQHRRPADYSNAKDLSQDKLVAHQHKYWIAWAVGAGIVMPLLIGLAVGSFWGAFFLGVCGRFFFIHQSVFLINSLCHYRGRKTYDLHSTARDSWLCAFLTHGEGFHSFHHRFPSDYRNGFRWYQWDPTKWAIMFLNWIGFAHDLKRTSETKVLQVRSEVEKERMMLALPEKSKIRWEKASEHLNGLYENLRVKLDKWELVRQEYVRMMRDISKGSTELLKMKSEQLQKARQDFMETRRVWCEAIQQYTAELQKFTPTPAV